MSVDYVTFSLDGKKIRVLFDRTQLKLGSFVYVLSSPTDEPTAVSASKSEGAAEWAVNWIAPSEWYVELTQGLALEPWFAQRVQDETRGHISRVDIDTALQCLVSRVRMEHFYKTNELSNNPISLIYSVLERLDVCSRMKHHEVDKALFCHHEPLVSYLYLTCFDRLGQPASWVDFGTWLESDQHSAERQAAPDTVPQTGRAIAEARTLYAHYVSLYGVRSSFYRFLQEVLPPEVHRELLDTIEIVKLRNPPDLKELTVGDKEKEKYLFRRRNDYTHKADYKPPAGEPLGRGYSNHLQEFHEDHWTDISTRNWPAILDKAVRAGLARYLLEIKKKA